MKIETSHLSLHSGQREVNRGTGLGLNLLIVAVSVTLIAPYAQYYF